MLLQQLFGTFDGDGIIGCRIAAADGSKRPCLGFGFAGQLDLPPVPFFVEIDCSRDAVFCFACFSGHHFSFLHTVSESDLLVGVIQKVIR